MLKDRVLTTQENSHQTRKQGRLAADPSSLKFQTERCASGLRRFNWLHHGRGRRRLVRATGLGKRQPHQQGS